MKLTDALNYCKKENVDVNFLLEPDMFGIELSSTYDIEKSPIKICTVHEYSVDDHTGYLKYVLFNNLPFVKIVSQHEDAVDVTIVNSDVYQQAFAFLSKFKKTPSYSEISFADVNIDLVQSFGATYNVMGENLIYLCPKSNKFFHIKSYWQDQDELNKDINRSYEDIYGYKYYEILLDDNSQLTVSYQNIFSVIGDSKELANKIVCGDIMVPNEQYLPSILYKFMYDVDFIDGMIPLIDMQLDKRCATKVMAHKIMTLNMYLYIKYGYYTNLKLGEFYGIEYTKTNDYDKLCDAMVACIKKMEDLECITDSVEYEYYRDETRKIFDNMDLYECKPHSIIVEDFIKLTIDYFGV